MDVSANSNGHAIQRISAAEAAERILSSRAGSLPAVAVFDVRDEASYRAGHVFGADRLTEDGFSTLVRTLPRATPVLVYCYHGNASRMWVQRFRDFRFKEVLSVDGGYGALAAAVAVREATNEWERSVSLLPLAVFA